MSEPVQPGLKDSDVIYLLIRRLERIAELMTQYRYGAELDDLFKDTTDILDWLAWNMNQRREASDAPTS